VPLPERQRWNHFWLVDPLDGEDGFGTGEGEFTVNIALIENQKPIAGVVHAPLSGTTYYAMAGKGAFMTVGDGQALVLRATPERQAGDPAAEHPASPSQALALCRFIESGGDATRDFVDTMQWHTAAPHAMARVIGRRVVVNNGTGELAYSSADWRNPRVRIA
jgi:3'(2'), 5'-bisphosphate nucleotidase